jgi:RING finger protein 113A
LISLVYLATPKLNMEVPVVKFKKRGAKAAPRKAAPPPPRSDSDESSGSEAEGEDGRVVKRRKTNGNALKASTADQKPSTTGLEGTTQYEANRSATIEASNDATKQSNWFEGDDNLSSKALLGSTRAKPTTTFIEKNPDAPTRQVGPQKSSSNVRTITVTDYTPDVCKDYKQTGFCGFGDNCKFLHAREDYAAGWKLDREWEMSTKGKKPGGTVVASANRDEKEKDEDGVDLALLEKIPFACIICKKPYKSPIITKCGHYFCEACALKRYRKDPTCAACNAKTYGVFNGAKNLQRLLEKKQKWEDKKKAEAEAAEKEDEDN